MSLQEISSIITVNQVQAHLASRQEQISLVILQTLILRIITMIHNNPPHRKEVQYQTNSDF